MRASRFRTAITVLTLLGVGGASLPTSVDARPAAARGATVVADPVGDYSWWFDAGDGGRITGTLST